jgi:hypothetical protein
MATARESVLAAVNAARTAINVPEVGLRPTAVTLRTRTWSGGRNGVGSATDVDLPITPTPRVRSLSAREVVASAGRYSPGDIAIEEITPAYPATAFGPAGGYTVAQLTSFRSANGVEVFLVLSGQLNGEFAITSFDNTQVTSYRLIARQRITTPSR